MFPFPLFNFLEDNPYVIELPIGMNDACYEVEDWLVDHGCVVYSTNPLIHKWVLPNEQVKMHFLLRWS